MYIVDLKQNTDEWLNFRQKRIGASDANIIMGVSKFMEPEELLRLKQGKEKREQKDNYITSRGHIVEEKVREYYNIYHDLDLKDTIVAEDDSPLMASLDGFDKEKNIIWEHKLVGASDFETVKNGELLYQYKPQV